MKKIKSIDLHLYVGYYLAGYNNFDDKKYIIYAEIIEVDQKEHKIKLKPINNDIEIIGYYKDDNEVELYSKEESILLLLNEF